MRVFIREQITQLIKTIYEGIEYTEKNTASPVVCQKILVDCLSAVSSVSDSLKQHLPENKFKLYLPAASQLQGDLEMLVSSPFSIEKANAALSAVKKGLLVLNDKLQKENEVKLEIVFLPYKASMWDSLESIWAAADKDDMCNAYVVPIPYYEKNPDGSFAKMHYEGNDFPEYVPIIDWKNVDLSRFKPDVIFFHNPYDNNNYVTSVHPKFYSSELKKCTDMLVYIPYFVLDGVSCDDKKSIEKVSSFFVNLGVINADKVIVQSEDVRTICINELVGLSDKLSRDYWERKILALGSPKTDRILNTKKEDLKIPDDWLKIIKKADGAYKKIILYNTSVSALLENSEKIINKMKYVFNVFKELKNDIALIWRPHPLFEATIKSMRPQLQAEYQSLVEAYKKENWGIYDDTSDFNTAMILSDAYYGDKSSLISLYKLLNKPVLLQDFDIFE